jgi:proliferating cell nuclear antigen
MKLMDIDADTLGIPDTDYDARVTMPSSEFSRIVRDLSQLGESVRIEVSKEGVRFASEGEAANGNILLRHTDTSGVNGKKGEGSKVKKENDDDEDEAEANEDEDDEEGEKKAKKIKKVKKEQGEDVEMNGEEEEDDGEFKAQSDGEEEQDEEESMSKKRKKAPGKVRS